MADKKDYHVEVAERLIKEIEVGTAPWQKHWEPGEDMLPHNPTTGRAYNGFNVLTLMSRNPDDPRWMTYKQAQAKGWQVRQGEKGTIIQYYKTHGQKPKLDEHHKPVFDADGKPVMVLTKLERSKFFHAVVFNATQIDGIPVLEKRAPEWNPHERAESIIITSGAKITNSVFGGAFYNPGTDTIHLPTKGQFANVDNYYSTAFHELAHWTGHASRLNRDMTDRYGSPGYAREELRAEISALLIGGKVGVGHQPRDSAAYVGSWIKALQDDPLEIFRAAADADKIQKFVLAYDLGRERVQFQELTSPLLDRCLNRLQAADTGRPAMVVDNSLCR